MPNAVRHFQPKMFGLAAFGAAVVLVALVAPGTEAHKAVTSPYNFNDHVFPILRDRCSRCHFPDGPAPMSLLTYNEALPWAESMREQLVGERMPPWYADPLGPAVKGGYSVTPRELDILRAALNQHHARYRQDRAAALKLVSTGEWPRNQKLDVAEHAAYAAVCNLILNLDEVITKE